MNWNEWNKHRNESSSSGGIDLLLLGVYLAPLIAFVFYGVIQFAFSLTPRIEGSIFAPIGFALCWWGFLIAAEWDLDDCIGISLGVGVMIFGAGSLMLPFEDVTTTTETTFTFEDDVQVHVLAHHDIQNICDELVFTFNSGGVYNVTLDDKYTVINADGLTVRSTGDDGKVWQPIGGSEVREYRREKLDADIKLSEWSTMTICYNGTCVTKEV